MAFLKNGGAAFLVVLVSVLAGCTSFDSRWEAAGGMRGAGKGLVGRWEGQWTSLNSGDSGALRCVFTRIDDHTCHAVFHATFNEAFYFDHTVDLEVRPIANGFAFHGREDSPWFKGGRCYFTGESVGDRLHATYLDNVDHGSFEVTRVK